MTAEIYRWNTHTHAHADTQGKMQQGSNPESTSGMGRDGMVWWTEGAILSVLGKTYPGQRRPSWRQRGQIDARASFRRSGAAGALQVALVFRRGRKERWRVRAVRSEDMKIYRGRKRRITI